MTGTRRRRVALVGPRPDSEGGVGAMLRLIRDSGLAESNDLVTVATYRDGTRQQKLAQAAGGLAYLAWLCAARRVDLVHLHASWDASFTRKAVALGICRATRRPAVLHIHGGGLHRELDRTGRLGEARRAAIRWALRDADAVVALTPTWADGLRDMAGGRTIEIIPNAPDLSGPRRIGRVNGSRTILFLGHLYREKGVFELIDAVARLAPERPGLNVVIAGAGRERDNLMAHARSLGLDDRTVQLPGWIGPDRKAELLASAAVFALPSYEEGLPLALLEAMAVGVPIVATAVGGIPDAVVDERDGLLIEPRDVDGLTDALARVLDDDALAARLSEAGRERAESEFSTDALARRVEAVYRGVTP